MTTSQASKARVVAKILLTVGLYAAAMIWVYRESLASRSVFRFMPLAASMAFTPCVLLLVLAASSIVTKVKRFAASLKVALISPEIREVLANAALGEGGHPRLRWLAANHYDAFEPIFTEFLSSFTGEVNAELRILAVELGLPERWRQNARSREILVRKAAIANLGRIGFAIDPALLQHPAEEIRIEAARALLASGADGSLAQVFEIFPNQSLLGRIELGEVLRPFAAELAERFFAQAMTSPDIGRVRACVDLIHAWERWVPIENFASVLSQGEIQNRLAALPAIRFAAGEHAADREILSLLQFPDELVHQAAAQAAADLHLAASIPMLLNQLRLDGPASALAAALALAQMGGEGTALLENEVLSSPRPQYALQALEQSLLSEIA